MRQHWLTIALLWLLTLTCCKKKEAAHKLTPKERETAMAKAAVEQQGLNAFTQALRKVLQWSAGQPASQRAQALPELVKRLEALPQKQLPEDVAAPWGRLLTAWQTLRDTGSASAEGERASAELNAALRAHGVVDVAF